MSWIVGLIGGVGALLGLFAFLAYLSRNNQPTRLDVAESIEAFLDGSGGPWDWDDFISVPINDPALDQIRKHCLSIPDEQPAGSGEVYCNAEGLRIMREYVRMLRRPSGNSAER